MAKRKTTKRKYKNAIKQVPFTPVEALEDFFRAIMESIGMYLVGTSILAHAYLVFICLK